MNKFQWGYGELALAYALAALSSAAVLYHARTPIPIIIFSIILLFVSAKTFEALYYALNVDIWLAKRRLNRKR